MTTDLTTLTPQQIDELWFPVMARRWELTERAWKIRRTLAKSLWTAEFEEAYERYLDRYSADRTHSYKLNLSWDAAEANRANERLNALLVELDEAAAELAPFETEWDRRGGWTRYVLVRAGHIHRQGCHTVRPTTAAVWDIRASGMTEADVVSTYGYVACTKCFADAPVADQPTPVEQGFCAGSGSYRVDDVDGSKRLYRPWGQCRECGQRVSVTSNGKARKHKS